MVEIISYTAQIVNKTGGFFTEPIKCSFPCKNFAEVEFKRKELKEELLQEYPKSIITISLTYKEKMPCAGDTAQSQ